MLVLKQFGQLNALDFLSPSQGCDVHACDSRLRLHGGEVKYLGIDLSITVCENLEMSAARSLDQAFYALSNPTRRAVVVRLGKGPATVGELAEPFEMALPSFMQHLRVLETSGLTSSRKCGRIRTVSIRPANLRRVARWLAEQQGIWQQRFDQLDDYLTTIEE